MNPTTSTARRTPTEPADLRGVVLDGRYQIGLPLSAGGMGMVYEGEQLALHRAVAIKLVKPGIDNREVQVRRLLREARTTARVEHPNVVEIHDVGVMQHGFVYLVMERLEGNDLRALLRKERTLPWTRARGIALQVVAALGAAHARNVIHRDIKPSNVFMVQQPAGTVGDFVKVLDFGLAKCRAEGRSSTLTGADEVVGTAAYLAPEVARGKKADVRSEVYAVGVLLYKMVTGTVPFRGSNPLDLLAKAIANPVPPPRSHNPSVPAAVDELIRRCLAKRPELRPQSMVELERDLVRLAGDGSERLGDPRAEQPRWREEEDPSDVLEAAVSEVLELDAEDVVALDSDVAEHDGSHPGERGKGALRLVPDPDPRIAADDVSVGQDVTQPWPRVSRTGTVVGPAPGPSEGHIPTPDFGVGLIYDDREIAAGSPVVFSSIDPGVGSWKRGLGIGLAAASAGVVVTLVLLFGLGLLVLPGWARPSTSARALGGMVGDGSSESTLVVGESAAGEGASSRTAEPERSLAMGPEIAASNEAGAPTDAGTSSEPATHGVPAATGPDRTREAAPVVSANPDASSGRSDAATPSPAPAASRSPKPHEASSRKRRSKVRKKARKRPASKPPARSRKRAPNNPTEPWKRAPVPSDHW